MLIVMLYGHGAVLSSHSVCQMVSFLPSRTLLGGLPVWDLDDEIAIQSVLSICATTVCSVAKQRTAEMLRGVKATISFNVLLALGVSALGAGVLFLLSRTITQETLDVLVLNR